MLNVEHRLMLQLAPNYDGLPVLNKLEAFEHALHKTDGQDVAKVLWLRSLNAEHWLTRRTNYTRSLAVMSMVGYILGLGDRHPSNLMLDRLTGKILHIDFGDCFEVATHRVIRSCATYFPSCNSAHSDISHVAGGGAPREVPGEDPVPAHAYARRGDGGADITRHGFRREK